MSCALGLSTRNCAPREDSTIGLNARFSDLIAGGKPLFLLLILTLVMIVLQNVIGVAGAVIFGYAPAVGVLFGSASLIGGHGTAIAWAPDVAQAAGMDNAVELGVAVATLGLVLAALVGGPIARLLVEGRGLSPDRPEEGPIAGLSHDAEHEEAQITSVSVARALLYLNLSIVAGYSVSVVLDTAGLKLPLFVPCLIMARWQGLPARHGRDRRGPGTASVHRARLPGDGLSAESGVFRRFRARLRWRSSPKCHWALSLPCRSCRSNCGAL